MKLSNEIKQLCLTEEKEHNTITGHWDKDKNRIKATGEVFTPTHLVLEMLEELDDSVWEDGKTFLDPTCGNGQFLAAIAIVKRELGHKDYLSSIYGVDLMQDNVNETRNRLAKIAGTNKFLDKNILCKDALKYNFSFEEEPRDLFEWE